MSSLISTLNTKGKIALALFGLLLSLAVYIHFAVNFWGDQDWELLVSRMWLDGTKLYQEQVAVSAPLIFYMYSLPVLLSRYLPLEDYQALVLLSLSVIAVAIAVSSKLIALHPGFQTSSLRLQCIVLLCYLCVIRILPPFFADREHLLQVLMFPYLLRWMPGLSHAMLRLRLRFFIGAFAAFGFFIKPHCLLVFAAIQLVSILRMRSLRILYSPENMMIYLFGIIYGAVVVIYNPEYLTLILPIAYYTYGAVHGYPGGFYQMLTALLLTFVMLRPVKHSPYRKDIYYFTALLPFLYVYARINNGWAYSYQPFMTVLLLTNGFMLWEFLERNRKTPGFKAKLGAALCLLNFTLETGYPLRYFYRVLHQPCRGDEQCPGEYYQPLLDEFKIAPVAHTFGTLSMDFGVWTRVSKLSGATWVTRFPQFWMLPKLYIADDAFYSAHQGIFFYVANALAEDFDHKKPDIVFVEVSDTLYSVHLDKPVDWVADFSTVPAFKKAWESYRLSRRIDNCTHLQPFEQITTKRPTAPGMHFKETNCLYDVYRRVP